MLKIGCVLAAIAGIGLIIGAVLGVAVDTEGITAAGTIAAIAAGGMFAVVWVALIVNWYQKRTMPVAEEEEEGKPSPSKEKSSSSRQKPSPSKP
jgi:zinc transporter ZupT